MPAPALQNPQVEAGTLLRAHARPWQLAHSGCTKAVRTTLYQATWGSNGPVTRCRCAEQPEPRLPPETVPAHVRASPPSPTCTSTFSPEPHPHLQLGGTIVIPPSAGGRSASPAARRRPSVPLPKSYVPPAGRPSPSPGGVGPMGSCRRDRRRRYAGQRGRLRPSTSCRYRRACPRAGRPRSGYSSTRG